MACKRRNRIYEKKVPERYGLEEYYNDVLSGTNGRQYGYIDGDDNFRAQLKAAVDAIMSILQ